MDRSGAVREWAKTRLEPLRTLSGIYRETDARDVHERASGDRRAPRRDQRRAWSRGDLDRGVALRGEVDGARKVVRGARWDDGQLHTSVGRGAKRLADRAVAAHHHEPVDPGAGSTGRLAWWLDVDDVGAAPQGAQQLLRIADAPRAIVQDHGNAHSSSVAAGAGARPGIGNGGAVRCCGVVGEREGSPLPIRTSTRASPRRS